MDEDSAAQAGRVRPPHRSAGSDELRPVTALFADVVGSTALGERLDPAEVKAVIGECVTRMCETVEALGGHVTGQMGDGIAAFFGLHLAHENDPLRAVRAALEIRSAVARFADEVREAWNVERLNVRIGVNSGRVAAGPVGGNEEVVIALGDAVNVAARLQSAATPGGIVVGRSTVELLPDRFVFNSLGDLAVKGRATRVRAFELVGVLLEPPIRAGQPLVGRAQELQHALSAVHELDAGRGQVLTIVGDGGIGKSRFLAEIRGRVPEGTRWLGVTCSALDYRLPYEPIDQALRSYLGVDEAASGIQLRTRFRAVLREVLGDSYESSAPQLARILGIELEDRLMKRLDGLPVDVLTRELQNSVAQWLSSISLSAPTVLAIDNLHDASDATAELVSSLIRRLHDLPILVILTMRPASGSPGWRTRIDALANHAPRCSDLALRPLDEASSHELVGHLDARSSLNERLRDVVVDRAEGNPLYIEQLVAAIRSDGEPCVYNVPRALESFLLSRIDSLSASAKRTLQAAAIVGRVFASDVVAAIAGADYSDAVTELLESNLITEHKRLPREFAFRHGLLRDAALSTLPMERRRKLHARAAAAYEAWADYEVEAHAGDLASHLVASGGSVRAAVCLEELGDRLSLVYRHEEAIDAYSRSLDVLRSNAIASGFFRVTAKCCEVMGLTGEIDRAVQLVDEALAHDPCTEVRHDLLLAKAKRLAEADRAPDVAGLLSEILEATDDPAVTAPALVLQAWLALGRQDVDSARAAAERLRNDGPPTPRIDFERASLLGGVAATVGEFALSHQYALEAQSIAEELGHVPSLLTARRRVGVTLRLLGSAREAYRVLSEVFDEYKRLGFVVGQLETAVNLVGCSVHCGELRGGRAVAEQALELSHEPAWRAMLLATLGQIETELGNCERAKDVVRELVELEREAPPWVGDLRRICELNLLCYESQWETAEAAAIEAIARLRPAGRDGDIGMLELIHAEIAANCGSWDEAFTRVTRAMARLESCEVCVSVQIERLFGLTLAHRDSEAGKARIEASLSVCRRLGLELEEARCLVALGQVDDGIRRESFAGARRIFSRTGCRFGLLELERAEIALAGVTSS